MKLVDLKGRQFGRLVVLDRALRTPSKQTRWLCACECGGSITTNGYNLKTGQTTSCGCFHREQAAELCRMRETTHGGTGSRLHRIWGHMKDRCFNPQNDAYRWYGLKGVSVCQEWLDFDAFRSWALANGYADGLTVDRLNSGGNYEPNNCEWVTRAENTRRMHASYRVAA